MTRGIVLSRRPEDGYPYPMVLIFENGFRCIRDFKLIPIFNIKLKTIEVPSNNFSERGTRRVLKEEAEPIMFGHMLEWDSRNGYDNAELVTEFSRVQSVYEARICEGQTQLLLQGVMSKNRKVIWMLDLWPDLEIPYELQHNSHPNVVVDAWVTVQIKPNHSLKYELHSFARPADRFQHIVRKAKWNTADDENVDVMYDPVTGERQNAQHAPVLSSLINAMRGIVASSKCILAEEERHRDVCFHRVVISEDDGFPPVGKLIFATIFMYARFFSGSHVRFNAEKLDFLNIYALKEVVNIAENQRAPVTERGHLKQTIRFCQDLPGFYHCQHYGIYLDDPHNVLEGWLLSEYTKSTLQVGLMAAEPSQRGIARYAITEVTDGKAHKIAAKRAEGKLQLKDELAVVIEDYGDLHVPKLPKSTIRLSREDTGKYPPGTVLRISGVLEKKFKITSVAVDEKMESFRAVTTFDDVTEQEQVLFCVPELRGCRELPSLLFAPVFGFVEAPKSFKMLRNPERVVFKNVWVTLNDCYPGDVFLPPARFRVFSFDEPSVEMENIAPYDTNTFSSECVDPEDHRAFALNNARVPLVNAAIDDEEADLRLKAQGIDLKTMIQEVVKRDDWKRDPAKMIEQEIQKHLRQCRECTDTELGDGCYFSEFLALALQADHEIIKTLNKRNLFTNVVLRRFH